MGSGPRTPNARGVWAGHVVGYAWWLPVDRSTALGWIFTEILGRSTAAIHALGDVEAWWRRRGRAKWPGVTTSLTPFDQVTSMESPGAGRSEPPFPRRSRVPRVRQPAAPSCRSRRGPAASNR